MSVTLALIESAVLCLAICGVVLAWAAGPAMYGPAVPMLLVGQTLAMFLCCATAFYLNDLYEYPVVRSFEKFSTRLPQALGVCLIFLSFVYFLWPGLMLPAEAFVSCLLLIPGVMIPLRALICGLIRSRAFVERVLILGTGPVARSLINALEENSWHGAAIVGICGDAEAYEPSAMRHPYLGPVDDLSGIVTRVQPDRILVALTERRGQLPIAELAGLKAQGVIVEDGVELHERLTGTIPLEALNTTAILFRRDFWKPALSERVSRALGMACCAVGLVLAAPLLALLAIAIKLDSAGPVFFLHRRIGLCGAPFNMIKLRTMRPVDQELSVWARDNEDRVTRVGRVLRMFRLDELPQLLNVLRGDMDLVGPRPHPCSNYSLYTEKISHYWLRCAIRPGITGWAQVRNGYANCLDEEIEKMTYDLYYLKHRSPLLDLRICVDTAKVVLLGRDSVVSAISRDAVREGLPARRDRWA